MLSNLQEEAADRLIEAMEHLLKLEANKWELSHGGISGRTAQQFVNYCLGMEKEI